MKWNKYTIETTTAAEDYMSSMLMDLGIYGIEIEDNLPFDDGLAADQYEELKPDLPPDQGISYVSFYLEIPGDGSGADSKKTLMEVRSALEELRAAVDVGSGRITSTETEDLDWINNWKQFFSSFYVDDILIKPTWEELKEEDRGRFMIEIDPGISFGTGKHETTQLCIRQLKKYIIGDEMHKPAVRAPKVLDIGFGSGILSIAALKLGAAFVAGTDVDPACIGAAEENLKVNGLDPALTEFFIGDLTGDEALRRRIGFEAYDLVAANLLADIIIPMAKVIPDFMKEGAYLITSGIIDFKESAVTEALKEAGLSIAEVNHQGEWVNITAVKK